MLMRFTGLALAAGALTEGRALFIVGQGGVYRVHTRTHGVLSRAK